MQEKWGKMTRKGEILEVEKLFVVFFSFFFLHYFFREYTYLPALYLVPNCVLVSETPLFEESRHLAGSALLKDIRSRGPKRQEREREEKARQVPGSRVNTRCWTLQAAPISIFFFFIDFSLSFSLRLFSRWYSFRTRRGAPEKRSTCWTVSRARGATIAEKNWFAAKRDSWKSGDRLFRRAILFS